MTDNNLANELKALAESSIHRSRLKKIKALQPEIENAVAHGVPAREIVELLSKRGIQITVRGLYDTMYKLRKKPTSTRKQTGGIKESKPADNDINIVISEPVTTANYARPKIKKTVEQLKAENPTMTAVQISKLFASQY